jgi:hypothetical protein
MHQCKDERVWQGLPWNKRTAFPCIYCLIHCTDRLGKRECPEHQRDCLEGSAKPQQLATTMLDVLPGELLEELSSWRMLLLSLSSLQAPQLCVHCHRMACDSNEQMQCGLHLFVELRFFQSDNRCDLHTTTAVRFLQEPLHAPASA